MFEQAWKQQSKQKKKKKKKKGGGGGKTIRKKEKTKNNCPISFGCLYTRKGRTESGTRSSRFSEPPAPSSSLIRSYPRPPEPGRMCRFLPYPQFWRPQPCPPPPPILRGQKREAKPLGAFELVLSKRGVAPRQWLSRLPQTYNHSLDPGVRIIWGCSPPKVINPQ